MIEVTQSEFLDLRKGREWKEFNTNPEDHVYTTTFTNDDSNECLYYTTYPDEGGEMVSKYYKYNRMKGEVRFAEINGKVVYD